MDLNTRYRLSPNATIRAECFGGLIYRCDNRRLYFLHSRLLVELLSSLDGTEPLSEVLKALVAGKGLGPDDRRALERVLARLEGMEIVDQVSAAKERVREAAFPGRGQAGKPAPRSPSREIFPGSRYGLLRQGLDAPICLTWELTYACNLRCLHCLSSSGEPRPGELTTAEAKRLIDEWAEMKVFYVNVGGGEPMIRPDFFELMDYALDRGIGVKFSTNGTLIDEAAADWIVSRDDPSASSEPALSPSTSSGRCLPKGQRLDVQISLDGATPETNDPVRGHGSYAHARQAMERLAARGFPFRINVVVTRQNLHQLDDLYALARGYGAQLRLTRLRPSGRGRDVWKAMRPTRVQNRRLYEWLLAHPDVLTGDSFFHLSAYGRPLDGLNMCGAGRIVCCVDPVGEVYACPFVLAPGFSAGNVREPGGFARVWRDSPLFAHLRRWQVGGACRSCRAFDLCHGGCMAVKYFTGVPLDDPDPDCVLAAGEADGVSTGTPAAGAEIYQSAGAEIATPRQVW